MMYVYVGKNAKGTSMYLVGEHVADALGATIISSLQRLKNGDTVVSIVFDDTEKVMSISRYVGKIRYICLVAGHPGDMSDGGVLHQLLCFTKVPMIVHSRHMKDYFMGMAKEYLNPSWVRKIASNITLVEYGVEEGFSPSDYDLTAKFRWIVPANRMGMTDKNLTAHARVCNKLSALSGRLGGVTTHDMYVSTAGVKALDAHDFRKTEFPAIYTLLPQPATRDEYRVNARKYGGFICMSVEESFGIFYLELLLSGVVGVFLDRPWIRKLLPDYPLLGKGEAEVAVMASDVMLNYEEHRRTLLDKTIPYIKERYSLSLFKSVLFDTVEKLCKEY